VRHRHGRLRRRWQRTRQRIPRRVPGRRRTRPHRGAAPLRDTVTRAGAAARVLPLRSSTRSFAEGLVWLAQIGLFVLLGLLVDPSDLGAELVPGIVIGLVLLLIARPLSVLVSLAGFRVPWREQIFLSWAG